MNVSTFCHYQKFFLQSVKSVMKNIKVKLIICLPVNGASGNEKIDNVIQEMQLKIDYMRYSI
jgi:hypothetical protein